jgi:hypothetical protein
MDVLSACYSREEPDLIGTSSTDTLPFPQLDVHRERAWEGLLGQQQSSERLFCRRDERQGEMILVKIHFSRMPSQRDNFRRSRQTMSNGLIHLLLRATDMLGQVVLPAPLAPCPHGVIASKPMQAKTL